MKKFFLLTSLFSLPVFAASLKVECVNPDTYFHSDFSLKDVKSFEELIQKCNFDKITFDVPDDAGHTGFASWNVPSLLFEENHIIDTGISTLPMPCTGTLHSSENFVCEVKADKLSPFGFKFVRTPQHVNSLEVSFTAYPSLTGVYHCRAI